MEIFQAWPKIPRIDNEKQFFTEKIDGTNAAVVIYPRPAIEIGEPVPLVTLYDNGRGYNIWAQSRNKLITPDDDNYGFAKWVVKNAEELLSLGDGHHFGEWWGQGIQRGYNLNEKRFSLFNTARWGKHNPNTPSCCHVVPSINANTIEEAIEILKTYGSIASPEFMNPEGVIVYKYLTKSYYKAIINK